MPSEGGHEKSGIEVGGEVSHHYRDVRRSTIRVMELVPGRKVTRLVLASYFNFIEDQAEW